MRRESISGRGLKFWAYIWKGRFTTRSITAGGDLISLGLAPELPGAMEVITVLNQKGVRVGIAHTGADYDQTMAAIDAGCQMATHSFNAMRGLHHRENMGNREGIRIVKHHRLTYRWFHSLVRK